MCKYVSKTKELIVDYRKRKAEHAPIHINGAVVEWVESFKFLSVHITNKLSWSKHITSVSASSIYAAVVYVSGG